MTMPAAPRRAGCPDISSEAIWRVTAATCSLRFLFGASTPGAPLICSRAPCRCRRLERCLMSVTNSLLPAELRRALRALSASMMPLLGLVGRRSALYSKIGMGAGLVPRRWLAGGGRCRVSPHPMRSQRCRAGSRAAPLRGRLAVEQLVDAVHAQRPEAALRRAALDVAGGARSTICSWIGVVDRQDLVDRRAAREARVEALVAAAADARACRRGTDPGVSCRSSSWKPDLLPLGAYHSLQCGQIVRTRRWATTSSSDEATR
jgi:hypothetical protein